VVLAVVALVLFTPAAAFGGVVEPTEDFYVADYAGVLSETTKAHIIEQNASLFERTGVQIVVVAVDFLDGMEIEDYAYKLFNDWGIGSKQRNNGVLLLLAIGEDNYWAVQGRGLESSLPSSDLGDILYDHLEADFAGRDYDRGVKKAFDALVARVERIYSANPTARPAYNAPSSAEEGTAGSSEIMGLAVLLLLAVGGLMYALQRSVMDEDGRYDITPAPPHPGKATHTSSAHTTHHYTDVDSVKNHQSVGTGGIPGNTGGRAGSSSGGFAGVRSNSGGTVGTGFGGGSSRGGGAGRSTSSGSSRSSSRSTSGSSRGGGSTRGGGAGRR
jgi:uncharacterized protein